MFRDEEDKMQRQEIPNYLECSISGSIFLEPVTVLPSGRTYEFEALYNWIKGLQSKDKTPTCPETRLPIDSMIKNFKLEEAVNEYLQNNPEKSSEQYQKKYPELKLGGQEIKLSELANLMIQKQSIQQESFDVLQSLSNSSDSEESQSLSVSQVSDISSSSSSEHERIPPSSRSMSAQAPSAFFTRSNSAVPESQSPGAMYNFQDEVEYKALKDKIQNHIWAFKFEVGPQPRGNIDNFALLFFAVIEQALLKPLPWQKIKVSKIKPDYPSEMHAVLKAAIKSLDEKNPEYFHAALALHDGKYDIVKTTFGGKKSMSHSDYAKNFAASFGTVNDQPGYYIYKLVNETKSFLEKTCPEYYNKTNSYVPENRF